MSNDFMQNWIAGFFLVLGIFLGMSVAFWLIIQLQLWIPWLGALAWGLLVCAGLGFLCACAEEVS